MYIQGCEMSSLKTGLSVVAAAVVGTALIAPTFVGMTLESKVKERVELINNSAGYNAEIVEYKNQWFSSSAKIQLTLDLTAGNAATPDAENIELDPITAVIDLDAAHGPVIFSDGLQLDWVALTAKVDGKSVSSHITTEAEQPLYSFNLNASLLGNFDFNDKMAQFDFDCSSCETPLQVAVKEYAGAGSYDDQNFEYHGMGGDSTFDSPSGELSFSGVAFDLTAQTTIEKLVSMNLYDSEGSITMKNLTFNGIEGKPPVVLNELAVITKTDLNDDTGLADMIVGYSLEEFKDGTNDGSDFDLEMTFKQIDSKFFVAYETFLKESQTAIEQGTDAKAAAETFVDVAVLDLLKAEPKMDITKLNGTLPQGSFSGSMASQLIGIEAIPDQMDDRKFWLSHTVADAELEGDKSLFEHWAALTVASQIRANPQAKDMPEEQIVMIAQQQSATVLLSLVQQGLLVAEENKYRSTVSLKDLALTVNGKAMPLPF